MPKRSRLLLVGLVGIAAFFRIQSLFNNHFHADEALFASWARLIAIWRDPLLLTKLVDKPPLLFYLQALFFPLVGPEEWAARLPNYMVSLLLIPLVAILAWHLYRDEVVSIMAGIFIALSPLTIQFSSTAFTDPMLTFLVTMSVFFIVYKPNPVVAGLSFGLAVATKHQAWLFLPLLFGLAWFCSWNWRHARKWLLAFVPIVTILFIRQIVQSGDLLIWTRQINNFGGIRLAWSWEIIGRLLTWGQLWRMALGGWLGIGMAILGLFMLAARSIQIRDKEAVVDLILIIFITGYMILHWLLAVPVWDRYMLPLIPFVIILIVRSIRCIMGWLLYRSNNLSWLGQAQMVKQIIPIAFLMFLLLLQIPGANAARAGTWNLGGHPDADQGTWQVAEFLVDEPYGTVLYDHWFSWQWGYHLLDKKVYVSWFQHPKALVEDLEVFGSTKDSRYLVLPASSEAAPVIRAVSESDFDLYQIMQTENKPGMILYRVERREGIE